MYLHAIREGIRMPSECNQGGSPTQSDALIEVSLKSFVGKVDEQLLERVLLKGLEPEDVEHADGALRVGRT
jgi:hypothetical protein